MTEDKRGRRGIGKDKDMGVRRWKRKEKEPRREQEENMIRR